MITWLEAMTGLTNVVKLRSRDLQGGRYYTWKGTVKAELGTRNLSEADVFDRKIWRKRVSEICKPCP